MLISKDILNHFELGCIKSKVLTAGQSGIKSDLSSSSTFQPLDEGPKMTTSKSSTKSGLSVSLNLPPSTGSATGNPRNKVALKPGHSLLDWIRLGQSGVDLTGVGGKRIEVTLDELAKHNTRNNAWICLKGKVYNVSHYMEYHPGGEDELMKGVGREATKLFNEVHQWVNAESMLQKCFVGYLDASPLTILTRPNVNGPLRPNAKDIEIVPFPKVPQDSKFETGDQLSSYWSWNQTETLAVIKCYVPESKITKNDVIITYDNLNDLLQLRLLTSLRIYSFQTYLPRKVKPNFKVFADNNDCGSNIEVTLEKVPASGDAAKWMQFENYQENIKNNLESNERNQSYMHYHQCSISAKYPITHDTRMFQIQLPLGTQMAIPIGYHVNIACTIHGVEVCRNYTPVVKQLTSFTDESKEESESRMIYLMIKIYPNGALTPELDGLHVGDVVKVSDHLGDFDASLLERNLHLVLLAAGTGFTPMVKLLHWALFQKDDRTVKLMFFNKEEEDILWKSELDDIAEKNPRLEICYVLSEANETWKGTSGRISRNLLDPWALMTPREVTLYCICGPKPFTEEGLRILEEMEIPKTQIHAFQG